MHETLFSAQRVPAGPHSLVFDFGGFARRAMLSQDRDAGAGAAQAARKQLCDAMRCVELSEGARTQVEQCRERLEGALVPLGSGVE
eukprot:1590099-Rhodomonas_salina.1